jgi:hypothetical protein
MGNAREKCPFDGCGWLDEPAPWDGIPLPFAVLDHTITQ